MSAADLESLPKRDAHRDLTHMSLHLCRERGMFSEESIDFTSRKMQVRTPRLRRTSQVLLGYNSARASRLESASGASRREGFLRPRREETTSSEMRVKGMNGGG